MTTPRENNPLSLIQKANSSLKYKRSVTLEQVAEVLHNHHLVQRMNERGLFITLLADIINYFYTTFSLRTKAFLNEINPVIRVQRKRREDGQENAPKRRPRKMRANLENVDINQLASQSVSNPSNLQAQTQRLLKAEEKNDNSKGTNSSQEAIKAPIVVDFNAELAKLGDIQADIPDFQAQLNSNINDSSDNTSGSNSTAVSVNLIPNLSQKLKIIGNDVSFEGRSTVPRRRAGIAGTTVRRREVSKIDISITLTQNQDSINRIIIPEKVIEQKSRAFEIQRQNQGLDQFIRGLSVHVKEQLFTRDNLLRLKHFCKSNVKNQQHFDHSRPQVDFNVSESLFDTQFGAPPSTYLSAGHDESDLNRITHENFDSNIFKGQENLTLTKLQKRTRRPKQQIFRKLLWMAPKGQVHMIQKNVQQFGEIEVTMISL